MPKKLAIHDIVFMKRANLLSWYVSGLSFPQKYEFSNMSSHGGGTVASLDMGIVNIPMAPPTCSLNLQRTDSIWREYPLVMTNIAIGKPPFLIGKPSISMGYLYHGYVK